MRHGTWGQTPAQYGQYHLFVLAQTARSQIVDKCALANSVTSLSTVDATQPRIMVTEDVSDMNRSFLAFPLAQLRAQLGHSPVLIKATLNVNLTYVSVSPLLRDVKIGLFRFLQEPLWGTTAVNNRYWDVAGAHPWGGDAGLYAPLPGVDHLAAPFSTLTLPAGTLNTGGCGPSNWKTLDITSELLYCLQAGVDLKFMACTYPIGSFAGVTSPAVIWFNADRVSYPGYMYYIEYWYMNDVEFYAALSNGSIDLTTLLNNQYDITTNVLNLGSAERGTVSTPKKAFIKNMGTRDLPHVEVWDDSPEWSLPVPASGNTGTGALAYITAPEFAVAQKLTIKFTSATDFYVRDQAYKDTYVDLQPLDSAQTNWIGNTAADLTLPASTGLIVIPAAAWSGAPLAGDSFIVYVTGNSTLSAWPYDSNQQIDMTYDSTNVADAANWRNIKTPRTDLEGAFTVNTTGTITITVKRVNPADYPAGRKICVANANTYDLGVIQSGATATSIPIQFASNSGNSYVAGDKVTCALVFRNLAKSLWSVTTAASGSDQTNPSYIQMTNASTLGFTAGMTILINDMVSGAQETAVIQSVDNSKIVCTAYLVNPYAAGSMVLAAGSGEAPLWNRINALAATAEELKRYRLNVRT